MPVCVVRDLIRREPQEWFAAPALMWCSLILLTLPPLLLPCRHDARLKLTGIPTLFKYADGAFGARIGAAQRRQA